MAPIIFLFQTNRTELRDNQSENKIWLIFSFTKKSFDENENIIFMVKIIKQELEFDECLKQRIEFTYELSKVTPTFINQW